MFVFPIKHEKQPLGDLWLVCDASRTLDELETRLVKQVANQCAIAMRQARLYQAAQSQVKELERLNQVKDDFLNMVSHELRSPMINIRMAARMLEKLIVHSDGQRGLQAENSDKSLAYLQIIQTECDRELSLIDDLLDLQQLEAGDRSVSVVPIELKQWISHLIEPFIERTQQRQQLFNLCIPANLPMMECDPDRLSRILVELLHNACKYSPTGGMITLSIRFCVSSDSFQFSVTNTGVEIPISEQERIFDKFYRIPNSDRWKQGGTGLGLAIVKRVVESLGGSIRLESVHLQTCFTVQLCKVSAIENRQPCQ